MIRITTLREAPERAPTEGPSENPYGTAQPSVLALLLMDQGKSLRGLGTLSLLVGILLLGRAFAQTFRGIEPPPLVRFTGILLPVEEDQPQSLHHSLYITIQGKAWLFRLARVENLTDSRYGWTLLRRLFPPRVRFTGPEHLIALLKELSEKPFTVEGRLYLGSRMLYVTAVEKAKEEPKRPRPEGIL